MMAAKYTMESQKVTCFLQRNLSKKKDKESYTKIATEKWLLI